MMVRIKSLVVLGFFAMLAHNLHAQLAAVGTIRCLPATHNYDFARLSNGTIATTNTRTNVITITATGTVILRIKGTFAASVPAPTLTSTAPVPGVPGSWAAWGTTGVPVVAGTYNLIIVAPFPGPGGMDPYFWIAGISDASGGCQEDMVYGRIGQNSGTTDFGTAPTQAQLDQLGTTCPGSGGGGGTDTGPIASPGAGNSPPNNKDRFTVLLNTGGRRLVVGQLQGNNFTSFGGVGTFNARNSLRDRNMLRLSYIPMISTSTASACCLSGLNRSISGSGNRAVAVRSRVSRGSGRVSRRR